MTTFKKEYVSYILVLLFGLFMSALAVSASTTINTSISTGGTLTVTGLSTLSGGATTTSITLLNGETITNATDGTIQLLGIASTTSITLLNGETITNATDGTIQLLGIASTTSITLLNGETITNATDGTIQLLGIASTTSITLLNGETITNGTDGTIAFGTANLTNTGNITVTSGYVNSPSYQVGQGSAFSSASNAPSKATLQQASYWSAVTSGNAVDVDLIAMDQVDVGRHLLFSVTAGGTNPLTVTSGVGMAVINTFADTASTTAEDVGDAIDCVITTTATAFCQTYAAD